MLLRTLAALLLSLCAVEILRLTLTPSPASVGIAHANLHPFATVRLYLRYGTLREQILQIGGNIAIGLPLGFLLPQITPRLRGLIRVVLVTAAFVTLIELVQWAFVRGRAFDVDDIILAAIGAAIGYIPLGRMFGLRLHPQHRHWWQRLLRRETPEPTAPAKPATSTGTSTETSTGRLRGRSRTLSGALGFRSAGRTASTTPATPAAAARSGAASDG
jgi:VanZ family protein